MTENKFKEMPESVVLSLDKNEADKYIVDLTTKARWGKGFKVHATSICKMKTLEADIPEDLYNTLEKGDLIFYLENDPSETLYSMKTNSCTSVSIKNKHSE